MKIFRKIADLWFGLVANVVFRLKGMDAKMHQLQEEIRQERLGRSNLEKRLQDALESNGILEDRFGKAEETIRGLERLIKGDPDNELHG
jgi:hypothetical protein